MPAVLSVRKPPVSSIESIHIPSVASVVRRHRLVVVSSSSRRHHISSPSRCRHFVAIAIALPRLTPNFNVGVNGGGGGWLPSVSIVNAQAAGKFMKLPREERSIKWISTMYLNCNCEKTCFGCSATSCSLFKMPSVSKVTPIQRSVLLLYTNIMECTRFARAAPLPTAVRREAEILVPFWFLVGPIMLSRTEVQEPLTPVFVSCESGIHSHAPKTMG